MWDPIEHDCDISKEQVHQWVQLALEKKIFIRIKDNGWQRIEIKGGVFHFNGGPEQRAASNLKYIFWTRLNKYNMIQVDDHVYLRNTHRNDQEKVVWKKYSLSG